MTNGLGSFASGTVSDARTRTYHGWMMAALDPPTQRRLLLAGIEASLDDRRCRYDLSTNYWGSGDVNPSGYQWLQSFQRYPIPTWTWGGEDWCLTRRIVMPYAWKGDEINSLPALAPALGGPAADDLAMEAAVQRQRLLVNYQYQGRIPAVLTLRPIIGDRGFHHQQSADEDLQFSQVTGDRQVLLQAIRPQQAGTAWALRWTQGDYYPEGVWYWDYCYPEETKRGLSDREDLYSPGYLVMPLEPGASVTLEVSLGNSGLSPLKAYSFKTAIAAEQARLDGQVERVRASNSKLAAALDQSNFGKSGSALSSGLEAASDALGRSEAPPEPAGVGPVSSGSPVSPGAVALRHLLLAGDQFVVYRRSVAGPTVLAGYPWFGDWGRDTLISLPGLALTTGQFALAKGLLRTFARYCSYGLIPNSFPDAGGHPFYNCLDASLWWIETLGLYLNATQDWDFLIEQYVTVQRIYKALTIGTLHNIRVDAGDGLLTWEAPRVALTWMDAVVQGQPVTPRQGKPIEINVLWYSSLRWANRWALWLQTHTDMPGLDRQARRYQQQANQVSAALQKFWNPRRGYFYDVISPDDRPDESIRPNVIVALSLSHCSFTASQGQAALRLARDRLLTPYGLRSLDPAEASYRGQYAGSFAEQDRAYHQGAAWTWLLGPFIRAWQRFLPHEPLPISLEPLIQHLHYEGGIGSISELFDGDPPHHAQGAIATAWSVAELIRHWSDLVD
ncbi:MAG: amylo-alpha-1,6-glucosidase [Elainellaceae cyanobacterium]